MAEESIRILGICGSPVKSGNVEYFLNQSLEAVKSLKGVTVKTILLNDRQISECNHCNWCVSHASLEQFCAIKDDMDYFYPELVEADAMLFASPVYIAKMSGVLACFLDRMRVFLAGKLRGCLKNKVAGALAVSWFRHGGLENTLTGIYSSLLLFEMLLVSNHHADAFFGGGAYSSIGGTGDFDEDDHLLVKKDLHGMYAGKTIAKRIVELARLIKAGQKNRLKEKKSIHLLGISKQSEELERIRLAR